jgi:hypothetical protein
MRNTAATDWLYVPLHKFTAAMFDYEVIVIVSILQRNVFEIYTW